MTPSPSCILGVGEKEAPSRLPFSHDWILLNTHSFCDWNSSFHLAWMQNTKEDDRRIQLSSHWKEPINYSWWKGIMVLWMSLQVFRGIVCEGRWVRKSKEWWLRPCRLPSWLLQTTHLLCKHPFLLTLSSFMVSTMLNECFHPNWDSFSKNSLHRVTNFSFYLAW